MPIQRILFTVYHWNIIISYNNILVWLPWLRCTHLMLTAILLHDFYLWLNAIYQGKTCVNVNGQRIYDPACGLVHWVCCFQKSILSFQFSVIEQISQHTVNSKLNVFYFAYTYTSFGSNKAYNILSEKIETFLYCLVIIIYLDPPKIGWQVAVSLLDDAFFLPKTVYFK